MVLILLFTINAGFSGTRLGLCWVMLEERYVEFQGEVRDPYPSIAEKAIGRAGRVISLVCISLTLYGGGCVFIVLISQLTQSLVANAGIHFHPFLVFLRGFLLLLYAICAANCSILFQA